ncbi:MAG: aspartate aminotransferase family protein [Burkholderiales bacterium]
MSHVMNTYGRLPVTFSHGEGAWLWDTDGKRYLDAVAGVAVNGLGHAHPRLVEAIAKQAGRLIHVSNLYRVAEQEALADLLCERSGLDAVFFCNSGAEANEGAIKLARLHGHNRGITEPAIIVMERAFHGRTMATLTATGNPKAQAGFEPLVPGFIRVPYDDLEAVRRVAAANPNVVAILVEPIQGEGGIRVPAPLPGYLQGLREVCDQHGWLLMLDEVQTGIGRTGRWFGFQHTPVLPDVLTLAKGLGSGVPVGALLARGAAATTFTPGKHGSTFGGNPLACTAALTTLQVMADEGLLAHAQNLGGWIVDAFRDRIGGLPGVVQVRGLGLMIGIELDRPCTQLVGEALAQGMLINVTQDCIIRLVPPLVLTAADARALVDGVSTLVSALLIGRDPARMAAA